LIPLRDDTGRSSTPVVNLLLIAANALLFFYELSLGPRLNSFVMAAAFVPAKITAGGLGPGDLGLGLQSGLLSMFLHGGWMHFLGNMLFLWIFGDNVEDRLGHARYLIFYLLSGYAATLAHFLSSPSSAVPAIGASGAISGVLGAYLFLHPKARIQTLIFFGFFARLTLVPAWVFLPLWFLIQLFSGFASLSVPDAEGGGVAFFAHIGGFVAGPVLLFLLGGGRRPRQPTELRY
jgi:membrane associated rhomboid family serine protease